MPSFSRRHFLQLTGLAALAPSLRAIEPFARTGTPRLRLSLAAYSFRDSFKDSTHPQKDGAERKLDIPAFVDYCGEHGCEGAELTSYYFPKDVTDDYLREVRRHAFVRGVSISGTAVGNNFAQAKGPALDAEVAGVKRWITRAALLGAPHVRVFAGSIAKDVAPDEARRNCIAALEECCAYAGTFGIFLGLENHGGMVAEPDQILDIVRAVNSPWFGVNLDTGNFHTADPYVDLARLAPYAVNVQIKADIRRAGAKEDEPTDYPRIAALLRAANYQGWVALEYEAAEDPRTGVPKALAALRPIFYGAPAADTWTPLFDGKSLDGWKITDFAGHGPVEVAGMGQITRRHGQSVSRRSCPAPASLPRCA